jgi:hypothetical protein
MIGGLQTRRARQDQTALGSEREETAQAVGLQKAMENERAKVQQDIENEDAAARIAATVAGNEASQANATARLEQSAATAEAAQIRGDIARNDRLDDKILRQENRVEDKAIAADKLLNTESRRYGQDLKKGGLIALGTTIAELENTLKPFLNEEGEVAGGNIPGVGGINNIDTMGIGNATTFLGDKFTDVVNYVTDASPEERAKPSGRDVRQDIQKTWNAIIKAEAGATQTIQEAIRQLRAGGLSATSSDEQLLEGIRAIDEIRGNEANNLKDAYGPDVVGRYEENMQARRGKETTSGLSPEEEEELKALSARFGD